MEEKQELINELVERMLEVYRMSVDEDMENRKQHERMQEMEQKYYTMLQEEYPELVEDFDEVMDEKAYRDIEEQKYIYKKGITDTIWFLKRLGIL